MKRTIFFRVYSSIAFLAYFVLIALSSFNVIKFNQFWFSGFLVLIGTIFFVRFLCYNIDSSMFLGIWLSTSGAVGILNNFFVFNLFVVTGLYVASFAFSALSIFIKFHQIFHFKVFVFAFLCVILLIAFGENFLPLVPFIVLLSITGTVILIFVILSIKANTRKV